MLVAVGFYASVVLWACQDSQTLKAQSYISEGQKLYQQKCANCHQADGKGLGLLIPPLAEADFLLKNEKKIACIIRNGLQGLIIVNGKEYNFKMPANEGLSERQIAQIASYVYFKWGGKTPPFYFTDDTVKTQLRVCEEAKP